MRKKYFLFAAIVVLLMSFVLPSCSKNSKDVVDEEPGSFDIQGSWVMGAYKDGLSKYEKIGNLKPDQYGYIFGENGKLIVRSSEGFCGTPPLTYADYDGSWSISGDVISIDRKFWVGRLVQKWQIVNTSKNAFSIKEISSEMIP